MDGDERQDESKSAFITVHRWFQISELESRSAQILGAEDEAGSIPTEPQRFVHGGLAGIATLQFAFE